MENLINGLTDIAGKMDKINRDMAAEEKTWRAEMADRERKGLTGDAAIEHYNAWMEAAGMPHLKVKQPNS